MTCPVRKDNWERAQNKEGEGEEGREREKECQRVGEREIERGEIKNEREGGWNSMLMPHCIVSAYYHMF